MVKIAKNNRNRSHSHMICNKNVDKSGYQKVSNGIRKVLCWQSSSWLFTHDIKVLYNSRRLNCSLHPRIVGDQIHRHLVV